MLSCQSGRISVERSKKFESAQSALTDHVSIHKELFLTSKIPVYLCMSELGLKVLFQYL